MNDVTLYKRNAKGDILRWHINELQDGTLFKLDLELPLKEKYLGMVWNRENKSLVAKNFIKYIKNNIN